MKSNGLYSLSGRLVFIYSWLRQSNRAAAKVMKWRDAQRSPNSLSDKLNTIKSNTIINAQLSALSLSPLTHTHTHTVHKVHMHTCKHTRTHIHARTHAYTHTHRHVHILTCVQIIFIRWHKLLAHKQAGPSYTIPPCILLTERISNLVHRCLCRTKHILV